MKKNYVLAIFIAILTSISVSAQVSYTGNGNTGFGEPIGGAGLSIDDDGTTVTCTLTKGSGDFNDMLVMYIHTGASGRTVIDGNVNDTDDSHRRGISNAGSGDIDFPTGFEARYAIAINAGFQALWEIPSTGSIGSNGLTFIKTTGGTFATTDASFSFSFDWSDIGLTNANNFEFVITYGNPDDGGGTNMFSSDEAFGDGIGGAGNPGTGAMAFTDNHSYPNTWTGTTDTDWATATNWTEGVPSTTDNVYIPDVTNQPTAAGAVTINKGVIKSGASLIAQSTFSGTITYERTIGTTNWYLISSPVVGQDIDAFEDVEGLATGTTASNVGLGDYNNTTPGWEYYQSGASGTGNFVSGDGRSLKLAASGDVTFTGTIDVNDAGVGIAMTSNTNRFNLVGNPYPSYIAANSNADATNNILSINGQSGTDDLHEDTLWFWNQATNSYDQINQASASMFIAPAQGFFVSSSGANTLDFEENMQSHQSDSFQRTTSTTRPEVLLTMTDGTEIRDADIYYIDGTSTGFDNGYDSSIFSGVENTFEIFTQAVANGTGRNLGIQSLPNSDFMNMIIPVGIIASNGTEITISASSVNLPAGINVYLEDKDDNSFTLLDNTSDFTTTLASDMNGIGRFYLRTTTAGTLSTDDFGLSNVSMYTSSRNNLRIVGIQNGTANIRIYNILGKQVLASSFEGNGVNDVTLPNIGTGIYIIQLETNLGKLNKKIIIE